jgi:L-fucose mutarotase
MLININPLLGPDFLFVLRAMGHGDEIAIVDGNYPAMTDAKKLIRADGIHATPILEAILSVMPLDDMVEEAAFIPHIEESQPIHATFAKIVSAHAPAITLYPLVGQDFYNRVKRAFAIVATSEPALYGNIVLRKGVVRPSS